MNGLPVRDNLHVPTDRWKIREMSLDEVDFAQEAASAFDAIALDAVVAFDISVDAHGNFVDARSGLPNPEVIAQYSRMKHGDLDAVGYFARHLAAMTMRSERFLSSVREAVLHERVVYMTTVAVFNVPSASNLLLRATAARLNVLLARGGLPPVVVAEQTRLSDGALGYTTREVRARSNEFAAGRGVTIVPEHFRGQSVVFLDDLFSTGYTIYRAERRLQNVNVADRFYLLAARMDSQAVGDSNGQVEDRLNDWFMGGSLESLGWMLKRGNFAVVQKLVKIVLYPRYTEQLPGFLAEVPTSSILKLYAAAASDGYWTRREQYGLPSVLVLQDVLQQRGAIDMEGNMLGAPAELLAPVF